MRLGRAGRFAPSRVRDTACAASASRHSSVFSRVLYRYQTPPREGNLPYHERTSCCGGREELRPVGLHLSRYGLEHDYLATKRTPFARSSHALPSYVRTPSPNSRIWQLLQGMRLRYRPSLGSVQTLCTGYGDGKGRMSSKLGSNTEASHLTSAVQTAEIASEKQEGRLQRQH